MLKISNEDKKQEEWKILFLKYVINQLELYFMAAVDLPQASTLLLELNSSTAFVRKLA